MTRTRPSAGPSWSPSAHPEPEKATPLAVNVEELNTEGVEYNPFVTDDGLTIYWEVRSAPPRGEPWSRESWIWTASRKDANSWFENKTRLFRGAGTTLTADRLGLFFRSADAEGVAVATRKSESEPFGRPRLVPELEFPGRDPVPRDISADGLTLYLDMQKPGPRPKTWYTWVSSRSNRTARWDTPRLVEARLPQEYAGLRFVMVQSTADGLRLFCLAGLPGQGGGERELTGVLSRPTPRGPFTSFQPIPLTAPNGATPVGHRPCYVAATRELFFSARGLFADEETAKRRQGDLWVVRDFTPPPSPYTTSPK